MNRIAEPVAVEWAAEPLDWRFDCAGFAEDSSAESCRFVRQIERLPREVAASPLSDMF